MRRKNGGQQSEICFLEGLSNVPIMERNLKRLFKTYSSIQMKIYSLLQLDFAGCVIYGRIYGATIGI